MQLTLKKITTDIHHEVTTRSDVILQTFVFI